MSLRNILGVNVWAADGTLAFERIRSAITEGRHERYAFLNAHGANLAHEDASFRQLLADFVVLPDGAGVDIASLWLHGRVFPANLNGTDLVPQFLRATARPIRVGLWGAAPGVAERAAQNWRTLFPQHRFDAIAHGFLGSADRDHHLDALTREPVDLLLVAMGNPRQERFIVEHLNERHARVVMGVGALLDFAAGRVPRAPSVLRRLRLEWIWRLGLEPRRMWRRYVLGNPLFLLRVSRQAKRSLG